MRPVITTLLSCLVTTLSFAQWSGTNPLTTSSNVGIGTTSPDHLLQVHSTSDPTFAIGKFNSNTGAQSTLQFNAGNASGSANSFRLRYYKDASNDRLGFIDGGNVEVLSLKNGGNVGIGVNNPQYALSLYSSENQTVLGGNTKSVLRLMNGYADAYGRRSEIQFAITQNNNELLAVIAAEYTASNGTVGGDLLFATTPTSSNSVFERMRIDRDGNVGIGTPSPSTKLEISADNVDLSILKLRNSAWACNQRAAIEFWNGGNKNYATSRIVSQMDGCGANGEALLFETQTAGETSPSVKLVIKNDGNVGIGTTSPGSFKLAVNGKIWTQEVNVQMTNPGPDYVFEKDYDLLSLSELETYITRNKHLPEVPSAKEMEVNGLNLKEMNLLLLKKVEELTLHLIEMKKQNESLEIKVDAQQKQINSLVNKAHTTSNR